MKKIIHFFVIVIIFSSLPLLYAQDTLDTPMEVAEVSYEMTPAEVDFADEGGIALDEEDTIPLNTQNSNNQHSPACTGFEYMMFAILGLLIILIISFRIRKNTLKLF
ncbi:MAG: hypothetical protein AAF611_23470 [Bacteroidota bacterium]